MKTVELKHFDYLEISGADAVSLLQGQVTCNMESLHENNSLRGALCSLKGRVIANFLLFKVNEKIILQTTLGMAEKILAVLAKYAVFSKVEMKHLKQALPALACFGEGCFQQLKEHINWKLGDSGQVTVNESLVFVQMSSSHEALQVIALDDAGLDLLNNLSSMSSKVAVEQWHRLEIEQGSINVDESMSEEFTPQLLNYDLSGVIDFKKGCYTGQEVVARMFYRSKAKKRLFLLACDHSIEPGHVIKFADQTAAILRYSNGSGEQGSSSLLLAILPTALAESNPSGGFTINGKSFLQFLTMPYTE